MPHCERAWAEIRLGRIQDNARAVRAAIGDGCRLLVPVKSDAYGHGLKEAARCLEAEADAFGVSTLQEAAALREAGIQKTALLLSSPFPGEYEGLREHGVTPSLCGLEAARGLSAWLAARGESMMVHVKVDTGMGRLGIRWDEASAALDEIFSLPGLKVEGLFTHLSSADESEDAESRLQLERFDALLGRIRETGRSVPLVHALNSPGLQRYPEARFDMVRAGGLVYGMNLLPTALRSVEVRQALSVRARVLAVQRLRKGDGAGYGAAFRAPRAMRVTVLAAGYGDGLFRAEGAALPVLVSGKRRFLAGRVSMNACAVALEDGDAVKPGDTATFLGEQGGEAIGLDEVARAWGTISYEAACHLGRMLPRVYVSE